MRFFAAVIFLSALALPRAFAQTADDQYILIYSLMQQADALGNNGQPRQALSEFVEAQNQLQSFQKVNPDWNPKIVNFRLNYLAEKIAEMTAKSPAGPTNEISQKITVTNAVSKVSAGNSAANSSSELNALRAQVQDLQANNSTLEAKLKEALTAQPAAVDPRELEKAREQIESLMKENDLLKATAAQNSAATAAISDTNAMAQTQLALAAANEKLAAQTERANKLELENQSLQTRVKSLLASPEAMEALREENALLKKQMAEMKTAANSPAAALDLENARKQIASLQSQVDVRVLENQALENRLKQLQTTGAVSATVSGNLNNDAQIRELTQERDDLLAKLGAANKIIYGGKKQNAAAQIGELTDQLNILRARLAVDEAQAVPYTTDELALFKKSAPQLADPDAEKKSIRDLPAGSAVLVAEAQSYFAERKFDQAENDYLKILRRDENNGLVLANLAAIEMEQGKLADAEKHIKAALAQNPDDAYNLSTLGKIEFARGNDDDALNALSRAAKLDPQNPEIENYLGVALGHKGLRAQAETALRKALEIDPNYAPANNNLAVIYINQQPPLADLARWHYQKALQAGQPRNPDLEKALAADGAPVNPE